MATDVYFSTNPADWEQLEGLYISERNPPGVISGADLSITGMASQCVRGPERVVDVTSPEQFLEIFGGRDYYDGGPLVGQVWAALLNKQFGRLAIRRVVAADAVVATLDLDDVVPTTIVRADASSTGAWATGANGVSIAVEDASDGDALKFDVVASYRGESVRYANLNTQAGFDNLETVVGTDDARWITLVKLADGRPLNAAAAPLASGVDGTLVAADYTEGVDELSAHEGVAVILVPEDSGFEATISGRYVTLAPTTPDRMYIAWSGVDQSVASEVTQVGTDITTRSDRIIWCYNLTYTIDPETSAEIPQGPHVWMASILSQTDVDVHPGDPDNSSLLAGIKRLARPNLTRADLISLRNAGISSLERTRSGFGFRSGVTTSLESGKTEITRRRMADFLQLGLAERLTSWVKKQNTTSRRASMDGEITAFLSELQDAERVVEAFSLTTTTKPSQRARGLELRLMQVRLIAHILHLVLETEIGTGVEITEQI